MSDSILVVDDEHEIADLIEVYLHNENYIVFKFYSAMDALACIDTTELDLAILDIMLPDMSGFTLCQKIREQHTYPIIMLTAKDEEIIWLAAVAIMFFVLLHFSLSRFIRYFNEINRGIDDLLNDDEAEISLPSEMSVTEKKLNTAKQTLKKRALEVRLTEQRKNDLVMYLAHDIKTPLTSVIGYLSLLDETPDMPLEQKAKYVHITLDKAYRLEKMVNEFFEIARYNLQQMSLEKETIDIYYMFVQITDELLPILSANGNTAMLKIDENLTIYGDPAKLARVFNNILKNAVAYSYPNTEISISAEKEDNSVVITFQNKGRTIPQKKLSTIFEKFYRLDEARTSNTGGAGLGLSIAKEIVTLHGGKITAQSENNTVTFIVILPITLGFS